MMKFAKIILVLILLHPLCGYALEVEEEEIHQRPRVPQVEHIYLELESIIAYFEVNNINEYKKLIPSIFSMPEKPLCRVRINDFYRMESAPPYLEAIVEILVKYKKPKDGKGILAWHYLGLTVTTEEALWVTG